MEHHPFPPSVGRIHLLGIGGVGMCPLAMLMQHLGYDIQGSQLESNENIERLQASGIRIFIGPHKPETIARCKVLVATMQSTCDNVEIRAARKAGIPVVHRAEMLSELMRHKRCVSVAGSHGKSTTTAIIGCVLEAAGLDPTVINGAKMKKYDNGHLRFPSDKSSRWMVVESDEHDGSFLRLSPHTIAAVVTNIDREHINAWPTEEASREGFARFLAGIPFYGMAVVCVDDSNVRITLETLDRPVIKYGFSEDADVRITNVTTSAKGQDFSVEVRDRVNNNTTRTISSLHLPMFGSHNIRNATAAVALAVELGIDDDSIRRGIASHEGLHRRMDVVGSINGVTIIDDYSHHPTGIAATIRAAKSSAGPGGDVIAVLDPGSIRDDIFLPEVSTCLRDARKTYVTELGTFNIGNPPPGVVYDDEYFLELLRKEDQCEIITLRGTEEKDSLAKRLAAEVKSGDVVLFMGYYPWGTNTARGMAEKLKGLMES